MQTARGLKRGGGKEKGRVTRARGKRCASGGGEMQTKAHVLEEGRRLRKRVEGGPKKISKEEQYFRTVRSGGEISITISLTLGVSGDGDLGKETHFDKPAEKKKTKE